MHAALTLVLPGSGAHMLDAHALSQPQHLYLAFAELLHNIVIDCR
jgi:hypothetical protein